jgi:hypothetical protein
MGVFMQVARIFHDPSSILPATMMNPVVMSRPKQICCSGACFNMHFCYHWGFVVETEKNEKELQHTNIGSICGYPTERVWNIRNTIDHLSFSILEPFKTQILGARISLIILHVFKIGGWSQVESHNCHEQHLQTKSC